MENVRTDEIAASSAPLSQAIAVGETVYVSGQIPRTPDGDLLTEDIREQTAQTLDNVETVLEAAGTSSENVAKTTVFLTDIGTLGDVNRVYREYMSDPLPARSAVEVSDLAVNGIGIEIEAVAER